MKKMGSSGSTFLFEVELSPNYVRVSNRDRYKVQVYIFFRAHVAHVVQNLTTIHTFFRIFFLTLSA